MMVLVDGMEPGMKKEIHPIHPINYRDRTFSEYGCLSSISHISVNLGHVLLFHIYVGLIGCQSTRNVRLPMMKFVSC